MSRTTTPMTFYAPPRAGPRITVRILLIKDALFKISFYKENLLLYRNFLLKLPWNIKILATFFIELTVAYEGKCFAIDKCPNPPPPMYPSKVCTSNGTTYPNENDFICAKLENKCKNASSMIKHKITFSLY
jgi:hypothetical protein